MPDYRTLARQFAAQAGINPNIFVAQINQESGFQPGAASGAGAQGIAQIVPKYHPDAPSASDPVGQLRWAANYMGGLVNKYGGYPQALSVYNSGQPDKYRDPNFASGQTYNYVKSILGAAKSSGDVQTLPYTGGGMDAQTLPFTPGTPTTISELGGPPGPSPLPALNALPVAPNVAPALLESMTKGGDTLLQGLLGANMASNQANLARSQQPLGGLPMPNMNLPAADVPSALGGSAMTTTPAQQIPQGGPPGIKPGVVEAFYDPLGSYDSGKFGGPIGGHDDHVHISDVTPQGMLNAIKLAQGMGLSVRENPYTENVDPVHTEGSYHYKTFPGLYDGKQLGQAIDVSGPPDLMARFYKVMTGGGGR